ncbi:DUF2254 domain-containing protein [Pontibacter arcticus]|uniref:DUF2254 domain-containing protein n=1 Tax=Pontibacter arcticus TaxID=2080288 RepID=A0A364RG44_9BACT|nr:DUF2254 domain-containing protein [Pontibacter arcticus]RAU83310.1 DUF2254 domain-containing protein [Pontibacter arcticus]
MNKILARFGFLYQYIVSSIGFLPTVISVFFSLLAFFLLYLERHGLSERLLDNLPFMIITRGSTANMILSTISTGIISLTVFSFSMLMIVLSQATANFTPRVIPGIITRKSNQVVLGLYLGTLIYTLIIMVNIRSESYSESLPGFAIFLAMCLAIVCLAFFVYFIQGISQNIQIETLMEDIYEQAAASLKREIEEDTKAQLETIVAHGTWYPILSPQTGYLQSIDTQAVTRLCRKHNLVLDFVQPLGNFVLQGVPFARVNRPLPDSVAWVKELQAHLNFYREERSDLNYFFGIKHLTESASKALSPGINDPGTAKKAIDYLSALLALRMQLTDEKVICDENGEARLRFAKDKFDEILHQTLAPIRLYGKSSSTIVVQLLQLMRSLLYQVEAYPHLLPVLQRQAMLILFDADQEVCNPGDREKINESVKTLNQLEVLPEPLPHLKAPSLILA